ncbi:FimV/HubP family polar landmark protein [Rheinheimera mangrovi]|uniref:FimV/HubP family polar landmark protein n=1 Tax=Rheinheimera mangrovi TaxID=2498451 RepID=UPI0013E06050|nr:FimV/HubP family polar landmark protein [Rheinheimera mangrovi]
MRLVGLLIFSILLQICSANATADTTVRLKGPKSTENPDRSRVGPLTPNDTLWRIAEEVRPHPGLNIYQVMYAIYLKNPQSFLDDNFNHLNVGSFLAIPNVDEILQVDAVDAQRKSEEDDRIWADRVRAAAAAKVKQGVNTAQQKDVDKAKQEIKQELSRVEGLQKGQLVDLQRKLAESKVTVEAVLADNTALKNKLDQLADQMLLMKSQVDKDSEIQQQLQLLVAQQSEMLAQQKAQIEREQQGMNFAELWQNISSSSLSWVLLATLPTLFVLFAVVGWIKRRTRKSEQIVNAATAVPQQEPGYRSPLPPLDESLDFDESSLMTLDESLLDSGSKSIRLDDEPIDLHDDMLLDTRADEFDDILMNDDDLLDSKDLLDASSMDDELLDDLLDQPVKESNKDFDPNNILSGADLSALFDEEPELDDSEDIFAQAVAEQLAEEQKQKQAEQNEDELDELLEEIELDEPDSDTSDLSNPVSVETDEFNLDEIEEVEEVDFDSLLDELVVTEDEPEAVGGAEGALDTSLDKTFDSQAEDAEDVVDVNPEQPHFDSSELDEFAESLADEELSEPEVLSLEDESDIDIDALLEDTVNRPDASDFDAVSEPEPDEFNVHEDDVAIDSAASFDTSLEFDEDDYPLSPDDVALLLSDEPVQEQAVDMPPNFHADHGDLAELIDEVDSQSEQLAENSSEVSDEDRYEVESNEAWQELADQAIEPALSESVPDLDLQEDLTVSRISAATLSVENPSKVLEEYPDLEFSDEAAPSDESEDELDDDQIQSSDVLAVDAAATQQANEDISAELDALEGTDFDALLADYAQTDTEIRLADEQIADAVLSELNPVEPHIEPVDRTIEIAEQEQSSAQAEQVQSNDLEFSLLALDKLLDDSEDESDQHQNPVRNIDVGLEDYQDFIAAQHEPELDPAEQGYAADLDLIRAYIEIGEQDGAEHLIDKVLNSAAPEHIKQEAQSLKEQL